jgi:hypothetical protein
MGVVLLAALGTLGCVCCGTTIPIGIVRGSGSIAQEERDVRGVSAVELSNVGNLHIERGEREALRIAAEENLLRHIETNVRDGTLEIRFRRGSRVIPSEPIHYYLTVTELRSVAVSGAGNVDAPVLATDEFSARISGAGNIAIAGLQADALEVRISGAGNLSVDEGAVDTQEIRISGAGDYGARGLESRTASIVLSGLGSATVHVREHLDVQISGAGTVRYEGQPTVEKQVTGVGSVQRMGE